MYTMFMDPLLIELHASEIKVDVFQTEMSFFYIELDTRRSFERFSDQGEFDGTFNFIKILFSKKTL